MRAAVVAAVTVLVFLAACGSSDENGAGGADTAEEPTLTIEDFRYTPDPLVVATGARVTVTNKDDAAHTVTADDGSFDSGSLAPKEQKALTTTFARAGDVSFTCSIHDYMRGVIRVGG